MSIFSIVDYVYLLNNFDLNKLKSFSKFVKKNNIFVVFDIRTLNVNCVINKNNIQFVCMLLT